MATTKKISELTALTSASANTFFVAIDGGSTYQIALDNIKNALFTSASITGSFSGSIFGYVANTQTSSFVTNSQTGSMVMQNLTVTGTASIQYLSVTYETASVIYSSGSNQFGDATNDVQTLIGTVIVSGSQSITGSLNVSGGITGSLQSLKAASGSVASFTGTPKTSSVTFTSAFANNLYAVNVIGEDARLFTIQSKTSAGFTINSNSSVALTGPVYWIATAFN